MRSLLCRFAWYRRWVGGDWRWIGQRWIRVEIEVIEPFSFFDDDFSLRDDIQQFLDRCDKENQRERT